VYTLSPTSKTLELQGKKSALEGFGRVKDRAGRAARQYTLHP